MSQTGKGCAVFGCLGFVLLGMAIGGVVIVGALVLNVDTTTAPEVLPPTRPTPPPEAATPTRGTPAPRPKSDPERFLPDPGEVRRFAREDDGPRYRLHYGFVDYAGERHDVTCTITKKAVERAEQSFGWDKQEIHSVVNAELQQTVDREIERRELTGVVVVTVRNDGGWSWSTPRFVADPDLEAQVERLQKWMNSDYQKVVARVEQRVFQQHGLRLHDNTVQIDHNGLAREATPDLQGCYDALVLSAGAVGSERYFMGLLLAFFQELKYELPPDTVGARDTMGLWPPAQVFAEGRGDCDSKSVAFAALWRQRPSRVIVILVPEHALIGVESKPGPNEAFVRVGNRYYVLCEVAGPGKLPPGYEPIHGSFEYVEIDPL
jgi:hypothetical protein